MGVVVRVEAGEALGSLECHIEELEEGSHLLHLREELNLSDHSVRLGGLPACHSSPTS